MPGPLEAVVKLHYPTPRLIWPVTWWGGGEFGCELQGVAWTERKGGPPLMPLCKPMYWVRQGWAECNYEGSRAMNSDDSRCHTCYSSPAPTSALHAVCRRRKRAPSRRRRSDSGNSWRGTRRGE